MKAHASVLKSLLILFAGWSVVTSSICQTAAADATALFDPNHLIQIEVTLSADDWQALRTSHRVQNETTSFQDKPYEYYPAEVTIDGEKVEKVGVRKKGFLGSVVSTRPSLKIKFGEYEKDREFRGMDMMTLNNNNQDPTHAQQLMAYNFANAAGALAPRCNLARVIVNGEDLGIYSHVESIRKPFIKRHFGKSNGDLYEGYAGDFTTNEVAKIVHKWGKDDEMTHLQPLVELLQRPGPVPIDEVEKLIDLDGFITLWACEVLMGHWDGYSSNRNNYYLYRDKKTEKLHFIPWGMDSVFNDPGIFIHWPVPKSVKAVGLLCNRLWKSPDMRVRYRKEMQRILDEAWNEQTLLAHLKQARTLSAPYLPDDAPEAVVTAESIHKFVSNRRTEIQAELDRPASDWPENPWAPAQGGGPPTFMNITGSFKTLMQESLPTKSPTVIGRPTDIFVKVPLGTGSGEIQYQIGDQVFAPFEKIGVQAFPDSNMPIRRGYPSIQIRAESGDGVKIWNLVLMLDPHVVETGENDLPSDMFTVWSVVAQGETGTPGMQGQFFGVGGRVKLDRYSDEPGATISGTFNLWTQAFKE